MRLTSLTAADLELILPWRNAPAVRRAMYSHHEISLPEHRAWFQRLQQDPSRRWYHGKLRVSRGEVGGREDRSVGSQRDKPKTGV